MNKTLLTLFSGGELAGVGARSLGYEHIGGVEYDPKIAEVARANGFPVTVADILDVDPRSFDRPNVLHASPVCTRASVANAKRGESPLDIAMGEKTSEFIQVLLPDRFTLENVQQYMKFEAFKGILRTLDENGYFYDYQVVNAADFGVPQTRRRLILRAVRGGWVPRLPEPVRWVGWYEAIEDLIPTLPESQFAEWQLKRLPEEVTTALFAQGGYNGKVSYAKQDEPANTIVSNHNQLTMKAFLMAGGNNWTPPVGDEQPAFTVGVSQANHPVRAFMFGDQQGQIVDAGDPACTVRAGENGGAAPRAFLVGGANTSDGQAAPGVGVSFEDEPTRAVAQNGNSWRAFIVDGNESNSKSGLQVIDMDEPHHTITASYTKHPSRAWLEQGRVVQMTPRALARFQSMPDSYILPENKTLAGKIIGNGLPCKLYEGILKSFE